MYSNGYVVSPFLQAILHQSGLDDFISLTTACDPLSCLLLDETGPLFVVNPIANPKASDPHYPTAYILFAVEVLTYNTEG